MRRCYNWTRLHKPISAQRPLASRWVLGEMVYHGVIVPYHYRGMEAFGPPTTLEDMQAAEKRWLASQGVTE